MSGLLFVFGIEILGSAIRCSTSIKGLEIEPGKCIKLAQYADDTRIIVRDPQSVYIIFDLLAVFEKCPNKLVKLELLWLGSKRFCKDTILMVIDVQQ